MSGFCMMCGPYVADENQIIILVTYRHEVGGGDLFDRRRAFSAADLVPLPTNYFLNLRKLAMLT